MLWSSLDYLTEGYNVLVVRLIENGGNNRQPCSHTHTIVILQAREREREGGEKHVDNKGE